MDYTEFTIYYDGLMTMSIHINEEDRGKGYSRTLMNNVITVLERSYDIRLDQLVFIDMDFSDGFWDHIGMKMNRYGIDYRGKRDVEGRGYEKYITWTDLKKWVRKSR